MSKANRNHMCITSTGLAVDDAMARGAGCSDESVVT
jgi:hypothetical protein